ncbi:MAG: trypsin-like peptidase domain-containing protein [Paludibacteraceae bacterium]|nr:trypsin-like peptidase domain-containing protein [Paludibacteraceae bacterium]
MIIATVIFFILLCVAFGIFAVVKPDLLKSIIAKIKQITTSKIPSNSKPQKEDNQVRTILREIKIKQDLLLTKQDLEQNNSEITAVIKENATSLQNQIIVLSRTIQELQESKNNSVENEMSKTVTEQKPIAEYPYVRYAQAVDSLQPLGFTNARLTKVRDKSIFLIVVKSETEAIYSLIPDNTMLVAVASMFDPVITNSSEYIFTSTNNQYIYRAGRCIAIIGRSVANCKKTKSKYLMKRVFILSLSLFALFLFSRAAIQVNGMQSTVRGVLSGNQVELQNGTKVVLLGIKPSENAKKYLEQHVKGKNVKIIADSKQPQTINSYLTTIYAYIRVEGEKGSVQRKLLLTRQTTPNPNQLCDSTHAFADACRAKQHPLLSYSELRTTMLPATFLISTEGSIGTGFFINNNGLALTNNHVWDGAKPAVIYRLTSNGDINTDNYRQISRVITTCKSGNVDYTIFIVQLDNGEKTSYLPLAEQKTTLGEQVAKLGCAMGEAANYNVGVLSKYDDEGFITHSINTNSGDSGSPVCNMRGEVVGIHVASRQNPERNGELARGLSYATDALLIKRVLDNLGIEYGR